MRTADYFCTKPLWLTFNRHQTETETQSWQGRQKEKGDSEQRQSTGPRLNGEDNGWRQTFGKNVRIQRRKRAAKGNNPAKKKEKSDPVTRLQPHTSTVNKNANEPQCKCNRSWGAKQNILIPTPPPQHTSPLPSDLLLLQLCNTKTPPGDDPLLNERNVNIVRTWSR